MFKTLMSDGYRPMILCTFLWSALCMGLWVLMWGDVSIPVPQAEPAWRGTDWRLGDWFLHEMLFGAGGAALASFMLVAIPNWAGHPIATGRGLVGLIGLWMVGRLAILFSVTLPWLIVLALDVGFLGFIALRSAQLLIKGKAPHNLPLACVAAFCACANVLFHIGALSPAGATTHPAARYGIALIVLMIALIGGRVLALFTRNWLNAQRHPRLIPFFDRLDAVTLMITAPALLLWAMHPNHITSALGLGMAASLNAARWVRWQRAVLWQEPLLISLQGAYLFVPVGLGLLAASLLFPAFPKAAALYAWLAGALGLMPTAVLARIALTQALHPIKGTRSDAAGFGLIFGAGLLFAIGSVFSSNTMAVLIGASFWIAGYSLLFHRYVQVLARPAP